MNEKEMFLNAWDREHKTTAKVLRAYPASKSDLKPAEKSRSARELAGVFCTEVSGIVGGVLKGQIDWANLPKTPATYQEVLTQFDADYPRITSGVRAMSDSDWNAPMDFPVGPGQMAKLRRADVLWGVLSDMIHHRGQFSVYLRMAGGKVPSIYGPSADEPWM